ncbi:MULTISPECIES: ParD-like family protein [unclassified Acidovorax]|uniref:ParD-like family protein n=1 Tax=unclassified Acidovorax TaxID=2684926 RepID=UPI002883475D|nr:MULTISPECIES: ParD-like family protein [unclassified Acidovorax]
MGIVRISDTMHDNLRTASDALSRSINAQAEHWMRIGMLSELYPALTYSDICQLLLHDAQAGVAATWERGTLGVTAVVRARKAAA